MPWLTPEWMTSLRIVEIARLVRLSRVPQLLLLVQEWCGRERASDRAQGSDPTALRREASNLRLTVVSPDTIKLVKLARASSPSAPSLCRARG